MHQGKSSIKFVQYGSQFPDCRFAMLVKRKGLLEVTFFSLPAEVKVHSIPLGPNSNPFQC